MRNSYLVCSLRACHMWLTRNHIFIREIWGKFTSFIFWNFEISLVSLGRFKNFKKVNSVNLSQISLLNMWLLVQIEMLIYCVCARMRIQSPVKRLKWRFFLRKQLTTFSRLKLFKKYSILDLWFLNAPLVQASKDFRHSS